MRSALIAGVLAVTACVASCTRTQDAPVAGSSAPPVGSTTIGWVDRPAADTVVGPRVEVSGWTLDPAGIRAVEIRLGGKTFPARFGLPRPDVAAEKPGFPDSATPGFAFEGDVEAVFERFSEHRQVAEIVAINALGAETIIARKNIVLATERSPWRSLYQSHARRDRAPFYLLPGLSGVTLGGAVELDSAYTSYLSPTFSVGMRVPLLYMRTTLGATRDWQFDPAWNVERRCGERRIAEDALNAVIAHAIKFRIPVLFTLNGGVWSDASCNVPEWDIVDTLEADPNNCQWNERNEVMADDHLKQLPGGQENPELGRMLTYNVYADRPRHYKKRNLQAAGRIVKAFAKAHPQLFVGVNLDPDTAHNPFFEQHQWYDYNPGTLRQFRHWLAGSGPYANRGGPGVPDLRAYRRERPLALPDVNRLSGSAFKRWDDVDPPRSFPTEGKPFWQDAWTHEWEKFRRHLIDLHYDELSAWLAEAGIPEDRIYSSQGFMAPHRTAMPFAIRIDSPAKNYDTGGISIEGAIPKRGHLGAVVYGPAARNDIPMETADSLFATFHRMDRGWGIVEFNTADLRNLTALPDYAMAYAALRDAFNYGARLLSPMAWNGSNGLFAGQPGYVSFMAWRNTPLEDAMRDFALSHAYVPLGARLWTFGSASFASDDGWTGWAGTSIAARNGFVELASRDAEASIVSPPRLAVARGAASFVVLGIAPAQRPAEVRVELQGPDGRWRASTVAPNLETNPAGLIVPLEWPADLASLERLRIVILPREGGGPLHIAHVALYPPSSVERVPVR